MHHVVATRLGVGVYDEHWLDYRLTLFENITFPSVTQQSFQDFDWLVAIDRAMPAAARTRLDEIVGDEPRVRLLELELKSDFVPAVTAACKAAVEPGGLVMTTRIDDDDALRLDAFAELQRTADDVIADNHRYAVLSFDLGHRWDPIDNVAYSAYHHSLGIGLSLIEPSEESRTVYSRKHNDIKSLMAPRGAYIGSLGANEHFWLYTTHAMADTDRGDTARVEKVRAHRHRFHLDPAELARFGVPGDIVERLRRLDGRTKESKAFRLSMRTERIEEMIREYRKKLSTASLHEREDLNILIESLDATRVSLGKDVSLAPLQPGGDPAIGGERATESPG